MEHMLNTER